MKRPFTPKMEQPDPSSSLHWTVKWVYCHGKKTLQTPIKRIILCTIATVTLLRDVATLNGSLTTVCAHPVIFKNHLDLSSERLVVETALGKN